jgi:RND superfamily putative drug exporter
MSVASFAPSIMVSIAIALSIDYSLFLLTRFREEKLKMLVAASKRRGRDRASDPVTAAEESRLQNFRAVKAMLRTAGHVVLVSGSTLMLTFLGLVFFPLSFLQSVGVGAAFALFCCLLVNLVLTPVLLLVFPTFFGTFRLLPSCLASRLTPRWRERIEGEINMKFQRLEAAARGHAGMDVPIGEAIHGVLSEADQPEDLEDVASDEAALLKKQEASFWYRSARFTTTTKFSFLVILLVLAASLPVCFFTTQLHTSSDVGLIFPRNSAALKAFQELNAKFQPGRIDPFHVLTTAPSVGGVWTPEFFQQQQGLVQRLVQANLVANESVTCISFFKSTPVSFEDAQRFFDPTDVGFTTPTAYLYRAIFGSAVDSTNSTTVMTLVTTFNPDGDVAPQWVDSVRAMLTDLDGTGGGSKWYLNGGATDDLDGSRKVNSLFPTLVALTVVCVFLIVAVLFRSFLVPLRLLFTIGLSITWVYGFAVLVFQKGIFNFVSANLRQTDTLFWMEITMTFSILVGLGLDYGECDRGDGLCGLSHESAGS